MQDNNNEKFLLIRNHNFFSGLTDEDFESLNLEHHFKETKKGEYIFFESMYRNKLYFIKGGHVKIGRIDEKGNEIVKEIIGEGEIFGQYTLERNTFNEEFAIAYKSDVSLCVFSVEDFEKLLERKPELTLRFNKEIGKKIKIYETRVLSLLNKDVKSRLAMFIYTIFKDEDIELKDDTEICIENILTHEDIANLIGSSRQTVTTFLNSFQDEGIIKIDRHKICLKNNKKLKIIANVV